MLLLHFQHCFFRRSQLIKVSVAKRATHKLQGLQVSNSSWEPQLPGDSFGAFLSMFLCLHARKKKAMPPISCVCVSFKSTEKGHILYLLAAMLLRTPGLIARTGVSISRDWLSCFQHHAAKTYRSGPTAFIAGPVTRSPAPDVQSQYIIYHWMSLDAA